MAVAQRPPLKASKLGALPIPSDAGPEHNKVLDRVFSLRPFTCDFKYVTRFGIAYESRANAVLVRMSLAGQRICVNVLFHALRT